MSPELIALLKQALALPVDERAALANILLDSIENVGQGKQADWDHEVARRIEDLKLGKAITVPWEELHRELRANADELSVPTEDRKPGALKGKIKIGPEFFEPLPAEELDLWE